MQWSALLLALMLGVGCAGTVCESIDYGGLHVQRGMRIVDVQAILGRPQLVYRGSDQLRFVEEFWQLRLGMSGTSEWVWLRPDPAVVVWTHQGKVTSIGTLPREVARSIPRPPGWMQDESSREKWPLLQGLAYTALHVLAFF